MLHYGEGKTFDNQNIVCVVRGCESGLTESKGYKSDTAHMFPISLLREFIQVRIIAVLFCYYSQGPKVIPQKYFPKDFSAFTCYKKINFESSHRPSIK